MLPLGDVQLHYMETTDDAFAFKRWLSEDRNRDILGFDLESRGLRHWRPQFRITLAQFGDCDTGWSFQPKQLGTLLYDVFRDYKGLIGGHNLGGFDLHALLAEEYPLPDRRRMHDSLPMSKLARANSYMHSLDSLINEYIGATSEASFAKHILDDAFEAHGFNKKTTNQELAERAWTEVARAGGAAFRVYSTMDVVSFCRIYAQLWKQVQDLGMEAAYWKEMGSWETTFVAEHKGIRVDLDYCAQYDEELTQEIKIVRTQLNELGVPEPSKRQKIAAKWLEEGWVPKEWNKKSGKPKLDKRVLEGLDHEAVGPLLEWSRLNHWQNNYIRSAMNLAVDGRVHPSINIMEAKTHRESARTPPFHQLPSRHPDAWKVRRMVLPEEGEKMCSIDYNAQELRITKHLTQDPVLTKIFDDGLDVHTVTGSLLFETRYENVTKTQRDFAKGWAYASGYGAQDPRLAAMLGVSVGEVAAFRQRVNGGFVGIAAYNEEIIRQVEHMYADTGEAYITASDGRRCYIDVKFGRLQSHQALNYPKQMEGGIILKESKNRVAAAGLAEHLVLAIHDEHLISVPPGKDGEEIKHEYASAMALVDGEYSIDMSTSAGDLTDYWSGH